MLQNYNKSRIHSYRGAKDVEISLDGTYIFKGEIARACGGTQGGTEAFGDVHIQSDFYNIYYKKYYMYYNKYNIHYNKYNIYIIINIICIIINIIYIIIHLANIHKVQDSS